LTKPLHHTQRLIQENEDKSVIVHLFIVPNYEMERLLLGFGCGIEILRPESLRKRMKNTLQKALAKYDKPDSTF
jgi:predicted DNA-binding transcriptional regulator YafY